MTKLFLEQSRTPVLLKKTFIKHSGTCYPLSNRSAIDLVLDGCLHDGNVGHYLMGVEGEKVDMRFGIRALLPITVGKPKCG